MALLPQTVGNVITIARNVTGRTDKSDPAFSDVNMLAYLNRFIQTEHPTECRIFQDRTWWEFTIDPTSPDPYPVDLDAIGFSTIGPPAYVEGYVTFWYENPIDFYNRWPETTTYQPSRPTDIMYYNNELTFRCPPDQEYWVKIQANRVLLGFTGSGAFSENIPAAYLLNYFAYGMSLDILSDFGEMDRYAEVFSVYRRYKGQVMARTWNQLSNQRTAPDF